MIRIRPVLTTLALTAAIALGSFGPARAHEFWLSPSRYRAAAGDTVEISAYIGTGFRGDLKPFAATKVARFHLRHAKTLDVSHAARNGDAVMARFVAPDAGGALVSYEGTFAHIELPAEEFDRYLKLEGLEGPLRARSKAGAPIPGRERYARCAKTWIAGSDPSRLLPPAGLTFELVPLTDPTRASEISVRAVFRGRPLAGTLIRAWQLPLPANGRPFDPATRDSVPPISEARTDAKGVASFRLKAAGEWLLSTVHMIPSADKKEADWESYWASLSFARESR